MKYAKTATYLFALFVCAASLTALRGQASSNDDKQQPAPVDQKSTTTEPVEYLSPFTVTASSAEGGYGTSESTSGRLAVPYLDTPENDFVLTSELMQDASLFSSRDAIKLMPGVAGDQNSVGNNSIILGTFNQFNYIDGFPIGHGNSNAVATTTFDTFFADRVELVEGPSAVTIGLGDPAGFINYVSKRPLFTQSTELGLLVGTGDSQQGTYRFTLDNNGYISNDKSTAYRFVFDDGQGATSQDFSNYRNVGALLSVTHNFAGGKGSLNVSGYYSRYFINVDSAFQTTLVDTPSQVGFAQLLENNGLPVTSFPTLPGNWAASFPGDGLEEDSSSITATLEYKLGEHWFTRQAFQFQTGELSGAYAGDTNQSVTESNGVLYLTQTPYLVYDHTRLPAYQGDFLGNYSFEQIGAKLTLIGGGEYNVVNETYSYIGGIPLNPQPLYSYNSYAPLDPSPYTGATYAYVNTGYFWSVYAEGELKLFHDKLLLSAAARKIIDHEQIDYLTTVTPAHTTTPVAPTFSVLYKINKSLSLFATDEKYIAPATFVNEYQFLSPTSDPRQSILFVEQPINQQIEAGLKGSFLDGAIGMTVTVFEQHLTGASRSVVQVANEPDGSQVVYLLAFPGDDHVRGWEFSAFGRVSKHLTFMLDGSFVATHSKQPDGSQIVTVPLIRTPNAMAGYAKYSFGKNEFDGFTITAGGKATFGGWNLYNPQYIYPNTVYFADLGLSYGFKGKWQIYIKGNNIIHKQAVVDGAGLVSGRQIFGGVNWRF